ncbi:MAG: gliding motility-associated C-terminal domain-containing protein [Saprospiraceae bacterium]|nr:gliding motility-associated C-terminal domain-containing protein [Saprospiraceae bacterium]
MHRFKNGYWAGFFYVMAFLLISTALHGQELCNNAIDDDGDGRIDLQDADCKCGNLLLNGDFETIWTDDSLAAYRYPGTFGQPRLFPAFWGSVLGQPRYFTDYLCGPLCDEVLSGNYGLYLSNTGENFQEIVGTCLAQPLQGGVSYRFGFHLGVSCDFSRATRPGGVCEGGYQSILFVYGKRTCALIADTTFTDCQASARYGLELLDTIWLPANEVDSNGNSISFIGKIERRFTVPAGKQYRMFLFGFPCQDDLVYHSVYLDNLRLEADPSGQLDILNSDACTGQVTLRVNAFDSVPPPGVTFQWYRDGIALPTETGPVLELIPADGPGTYEVTWDDGGSCGHSLYTYLPPAVDLSIHTDGFRLCPGDTLHLSIEASDFDNYFWNTGSTDARISVHRPGHYEAEVFWSDRGQHCSATLGLFIDPGDTIPVRIMTQPVSHGQDGLIDIQTPLNLLGINWSDGYPGLLRRTGLDTGTYCVMLDRANFCPLDTCISITSFPDSLVCVEEISHPSCPEAPDGTLRLNITGGLLPYRVILNGLEYQTDSSIVFQDLVAGDYDWRVVDGEGDVCTGRISLQDIPMGWDVVAAPVYCSDGRNGRLEIRPAVNSGAIEVVWPDGVWGLDRHDLKPGYHTFVVVQGSCFILDSALVDVVGEPRAIVPQVGLESCDPRRGYIDFGFLDVPGDPEVGLVGSQAGSSGYFGGLQTDTVYSFWIRSPEGCVDTVQVALPVFPILQVTIRVLDSMGSVFRLGLSQNIHPHQLEWLNRTLQTSCNGCSEWKVTQSHQKQIIQVLATDSSGCQAGDTLVIPAAITDEVYLPNIFSPNGDLINDTWEVSAVNAMPYRILIRDRWGNVILDQKGEDLREISWDGTSDGRLVLPGVYLVQLLLYPDTLRQRLVNECITLIR